MRRWCTTLVFAVLICLLSPLLLLAKEQPVRLTILHVNDVHGHILPFIDKTVSETVPVGGAAYLAAMVEAERAKNPDGTLLLSAGDMFQGTPVSNFFQGHSVIDVMNYLRFDAMAIGNHEFDWGRDSLKNLESWAEFPFLSANIVERDGRCLAEAERYILLVRKKLRIALIGITTPETIYATKPSNVAGLVFQDPAEVLPSLIQEVKLRGASLVILLSHNGLEADKELARRVSGIDVIVGGHSHTAVINPVKIGGTIIVQAGSYGLYLGVLQLKVDPSRKKIVEYTRKHELKTVFSGKHNSFDPKVAEVADKYEDQIKTEFAREVGQTSVDLRRRSDAESNLGDLACDATIESSGADVAFQNSGGIRGDLAQGKITMGDVLTAFPFDTLLVSMDLTGKQILGILEQSAGSERNIIQVSGIAVQYDLTKPPGSRVMKATLKNGPLDPEKTYRVVTNDFLAAGGDHYSIFKEGSNIVYGDSLRDAFVAYLQRHSPVSTQVQERITFVK